MKNKGPVFEWVYRFILGAILSYFAYTNTFFITKDRFEAHKENDYLWREQHREWEEEVSRGMELKLEAIRMDIRRLESRITAKGIINIPGTLPIPLGIPFWSITNVLTDNPNKYINYGNNN